MRSGKLQRLLLLLCVASGIDAYTFSCEEVKYQLINSRRREFDVTQACVVVQEGFTNWAQLSILSVVTGFDAYYFDAIGKSESKCVSRKDAANMWRVTASADLKLDCSQEFTLFFSGVEAQVVAPTKQVTAASWDSDMVTFVVPQTGMWIHALSCTSRLEGGITVMTGGGRGEAEENYVLRFYNCTTWPDWIVSFDNIISISADYTTSVRIEYSSALVIPAAYGEQITVFSSGQADDLQNLQGGVDHRAIIQLSKNALVTAKVQLIFDQTNYGSLVLKESAKGSDKKFFNGTYTEQFNTNYFEIGYVPTGKQPSEIGYSGDRISVDFTIGKDVPAPTTAPVVSEKSPYCDCSLDKNGLPNGWDTKEIWLDIVVVLDTSEAMGADRLDKATQLVQSIVTGYLSTNPNFYLYSRVGVISMTEGGQVVYNLNMKPGDKIQASIKKGLKNIDLTKAFDDAVIMLKAGVNSHTERATTRQVIYFMTDSDASTLTEQPFGAFKKSGVIIVNNLLDEGTTERPGLKKLASNGYYYSSSSEMHELQSFCEANCFCGPDKIAYEGSDAPDKASGGCYQFNKVGVAYNRAKTACADLNGGIIATIHDDQKGRFLQTLVTDFRSDYFWIGYEKVTTGDWQWEDKSTNPYTNWSPNEPSSAEVSKCAYLDRLDGKGTWGAGNCLLGFPVICQYPPCSVGKKTC